eukprot:TRINITY_DN17186_c0_g1_i1.p1 TRINITY_DN17186_c0_g1~~TRINITY_DN17186_c0_g1_i1.p1  ORF type:complete len:180 (+),score=19.06 TRINITY_DN17186_c0_g1_i1:72-542(+)
MSGAEARKAARGTYLLQAAAALAPSCPALAREAGRAALSLFAREARAEGALLSQLRPLLSRVCGGCGGALADPHTATVSICTVRDAARLQRTVRAEGGAVVSTLRTARLRDCDPPPRAHPREGRGSVRGACTGVRSPRRSYRRTPGPRGRSDGGIA